MSLSFSKVKHNLGLNNRVHIYDVTFDSSYPTGGETVAASDFGMTSGTINGIICVDKTATAANNRLVTYNPTSGKLVVWTAVGTEATDTSNQSAVVVRCYVWLDRSGAATS